MKSKSVVERTLKAGEKVLKEAIPESSHQKYMHGYVNALKYVLELEELYDTSQ